MLQQRIMIGGLIVLLCVSACTDNITNVQAGGGANSPPQILLSGPDYVAGARIKSPLPQPWVIAADPDSADGIVAVVLKISSISLVSLIVRPDDSTLECSRPFYASMDTIDVLPYLKKQTFSVLQPLVQSNDGAYHAYLSYNLLSEGGIVNHGDVFGQVVKPCRYGDDYLSMVEHFGLFPPALPVPRDVYVTYAEFSISGITFTAYDRSGATATVTFPDFIGIFTNSTEDQTPP